MNLTFNVIKKDGGWKWFRFYGKDKAIPLHTIVVSPATSESKYSAVYFDTYIDGHTIEFKRLYHEPVDDIYAEIPVLLNWVVEMFQQFADIIQDIVKACPELVSGD